jgi:hypothetical protein
MAKAYRYTLPNGYYVGAPVEDRGFLPSNATYDAPVIIQGSWPRWSGSAWEQVEDHRERTVGKGFVPDAVQEATEFWLPEDNWQSPARTMTEIGPLPAGAVLVRPEPTEAELRAMREAEFNAAILSRLNAFAAEKQYDDINAARLAALSSEYAADGHAAQTAYDATWSAAIAIWEQVASGEITVEQAVEQLPALAWEV